jgi:hypothetical protein
MPAMIMESFCLWHLDNFEFVLTGDKSFASLDLFMKQFDYLANSDYISPQQKAEARQNAIDMGLLPREAGGPEVQPATAPPKGTDS